MKTMVLTALLLMTLAACTDDSGNYGSRKSKDPSPVTSDPSGTGEPIDPEKADLHPLETREIETVRVELRKRISVSKWREYSRQQRSVLAGAALQTAVASVRTLDWTTVTDRDIEYLLNLFFDSELYLLMKGSPL